MKKPSKTRAVVTYPSHLCKPEGLLSFVEMSGFSDNWKELGLNDDTLHLLQIAIMTDPSREPIIKETGGLRKLRFSLPNEQSGKRGGVRVCYVYFEEFALVLLVMAYRKNVKDDLSKAEKKAVAALIDRQWAALAKKPRR